MKKIIAVAAVTTLAMSAQSALAQPFSGPYFGVEASHDSYEVKAKDLVVGGATVSADGISGNGASGGIYAGYDVSIGEGFVGVEAGFDYSGAKVSVSSTSGGIVDEANVKARETYSVAARAGYKVASSTGLYAKLGYANTRFKTELTSAGVSSFSDSRSKGAFVYGGGIETGLADNLSVRAEFTVSDYNDAGLNSTFGANGIKVSNSKTSVGVSYRF